MAKDLTKDEILERIAAEDAEERRPKSATEKLAELQLAEYEERAAAKAQEIENMKKFRLINALEAKRRQEEIQQTQAMCNHRKPNNSSAVVAYRAQDYIEHHICQNCFREWHGDEVPNPLRPPREHIGGPI